MFIFLGYKTFRIGVLLFTPPAFIYGYFGFGCAGFDILFFCSFGITKNYNL